MSLTLKLMKRKLAQKKKKKRRKGERVRTTNTGQERADLTASKSVYENDVEMEKESGLCFPESEVGVDVTVLRLPFSVPISTSPNICYFQFCITKDPDTIQ